MANNVIYALNYILILDGVLTVGHDNCSSITLRLTVIDSIIKLKIMMTVLLTNQTITVIVPFIICKIKNIVLVMKQIIMAMIFVIMLTTTTMKPAVMHRIVKMTAIIFETIMILVGVMGETFMTIEKILSFSIIALF